MSVVLLDHMNLRAERSFEQDVVDHGRVCEGGVISSLINER
jgi:hypothetical protein